MKCCTFFGHHDCPDSVRLQLQEAIKTQIAQGTTAFYVGNHGHFDALVLSCLRELKKEHTEISYTVVLAYLPTQIHFYAPEETVLPDGIETVGKRFAIDFRNHWMLNHADTVIAYITHDWGGAAKYVCFAERKGKAVVRIDKPKTAIQAFIP